MADYLAELQDFRAQREASLRRDYGWLSLDGLFWLDEGDNSFGSAAENPIRLPDRAPGQAGVFTLSTGKVRATPATDVLIRMNDDQLLASGAELQPDTSGKPDFLFIDDIRVVVIERAGQLAIRTWDPKRASRRIFAGCKWFAPNDKFRVTAKVEAYPEPKKVIVDDIVGIQRPGVMHALLAFELDGKQCRLEAERLEDNTYDLIFKDSTAGKNTYGAGRYLSTEIAERDEVVIDFNKAYNPPCAFTEFATCPLPQQQNILDVAIEAGEQI
jgi:uncharacterized protein (DUF1684 family)